MKALILISATLLFSGCMTDAEWNRVNWGAAANSPMFNQQQQNQAEEKRMDWTCQNQCTQAGYEYGFCNSKCSY